MNKNTKLALAITLVVLAGAAIVYSANSSASLDKGFATFESADKNGDGVLDRAEFANFLKSAASLNAGGKGRGRGGRGHGGEGCGGGGGTWGGCGGGGCGHGGKGCGGGGCDMEATPVAAVVNAEAKAAAAAVVTRRRGCGGGGCGHGGDGCGGSGPGTQWRRLRWRRLRTGGGGCGHGGDGCGGGGCGHGARLRRRGRGRRDRRRAVEDALLAENSARKSLLLLSRPIEEAALLRVAPARNLFLLRSRPVEELLLLRNELLIASQ